MNAPAYNTEAPNKCWIMDRNFALEAVRVTEAAALASSHWTGRGQEKAADQAAVNAMREALNGLTIDGTVVIGEGERDDPVGGFFAGHYLQVEFNLAECRLTHSFPPTVD